ncbi:MAG: VWA domain-containing protein [Candidatus Omnitrophica bacterium]|nr:VWA domain-containing protein [Candidatus Omnitrophota bacterium]
MIFKNPFVLSLLLAYFFALFITRQKRRERGFIFPTDELIKGFRGNFKLWLIRKVPYLRILGVILVILALARPQLAREAEIKKEGIAIMLAIDTSSTMTADDIKLGLEDMVEKDMLGKSRNVTRIDAVKEVARDFINSRENDIIGVIAFAADAFVVCPPTFDHEWLLKSLERVKIGIIKDGTAIGSGILSSLNSLKDVEARSKVIVLLTDGINNFGRISPLVAAKAARALGVKIYPIGVVRAGGGLQEADDGSGRRVYREPVIQVDEEELKKIATLTDGAYFRASDMNTLRESYREIDRLEKTGIEQKSFEEYVDVFQYFIFPALGLLLLEMILRNTFLRRIP